MWGGYFEVGGNEVGNSLRAMTLARTAECAVHWFRDIECGGLLDALGEEQDAYDFSRIDEAPWYDPDKPELTSRFLGLYVISMEGVSDSTRSAVVTEKVLDGAQVSGYRHTSRSVRIRALLTAKGEDALEYGMTWLRNVLEPNACGMHGSDMHSGGSLCGSSDFSFFVSCPPAKEEAETDPDYAARIDEYRRFLHTVTCVSGPLVQNVLASSDKETNGYIVEFTMLAAVPFVYGVTREIPVPPSVPSVLQDTPFNLITYPSAEIGTGTIVAATNYSTNPSVEVDATGWNATTEVVSGTSPAAFFTSGRVTGELSANGTSAFRGRILGNNGTTSVTNARSYIWLEQQVATTGFANGTRMSFNIWAALIIQAGASGSTLNGVQVTAVWRTGTTTLGTVTVGTGTTGDYGGKAYTIKSQLKPNAADNVLVRVRFDVTWSSSSTPANNSEIRAYVDALAATVP